MNSFITKDGNDLVCIDAFIAGRETDIRANIFKSGLCLSSDNKME